MTFHTTFKLHCREEQMCMPSHTVHPHLDLPQTGSCPHQEIMHQTWKCCMQVRTAQEVAYHSLHSFKSILIGCPCGLKQILKRNVIEKAHRLHKTVSAPRARLLERIPALHSSQSLLQQPDLPFPHLTSTHVQLQAATCHNPC